MKCRCDKCGQASNQSEVSWKFCRRLIDGRSCHGRFRAVGGKSYEAYRDMLQRSADFEQERQRREAWGWDLNEADKTKGVW